MKKNKKKRKKRRTRRKEEDDDEEEEEEYRGQRRQYGAYAFTQVPKVTNTHTHTLRICNTYCFFTVTMVARTPLNVTLYCTYSTLSLLYILH